MSGKVLTRMTIGSKWGSAKAILVEIDFGKEMGGFSSISRRHLNGYIQVPEGHPWHGKSYWDMDDPNTHGGITFGEEVKDFHDDLTGFVVGFDMGHGCDQQRNRLLDDPTTRDARVFDGLKCLKDFIKDFKAGKIRVREE